MGGGLACPNCGAQNPADQRFCGSCGASLSLPCPACGTPNPPGYAFCGSCGEPLAEPAPTAAERPQPPQAEPGREERRLATVLFADLSGFTSLSERMDPEDVKALAHDLAGRMSEEVRKFGGTVVSVMGDAVMAVFGAPVTHEDDAERAVRAALGMRETIRHETETGLPLQLHIGINTGQVMAGLVGPEERRDYTVMGDVTNTAARLQSAARPGEILVGGATRDATAPVVDYEPVEPITAKGKVEPVPAWRAVGALAKPVERAPSMAPLVGRTAELELLERLWNQTASARQPRLVTVLGPPGIGKSRLFREFQNSVEDRARVLRGRCLPYGETSGYDAFGSQIEQDAGLLESEPGPVARSKLRRRVRGLLPEEEAAEVGAHIEVLLGLSTEGAPDKQLLFFSARRYVEALGRERPTILGFEDIHWAQPALLDLLEYLGGRVRDVPLLIVTMSRPELLDSRPTWGGGLPGYTAAPLEALSDGDSRRLAVSLLKSDPSAAGAIDNLVQTGGGNPLFLEELAASVSERAAGSTAALPTNVQAIIAARLDALPTKERTLLQEASIIGRFFWIGVLRALAGDPAGVDEALDRLEARNLIRRQPSSRLAGDQEFMFKHILTQEVAYASLPRAARRQGHGRVAVHLENALGERARESASLLAHHWREAGDGPAAARYLLMAAEVASRAWAKQEAIALYTEAIELLEQAGDHERRHQTLLDRAVATLGQGNFAQGAADLDGLLEEVSGPIRARALLARARAANWLVDAEGVHRFGEMAVAAARELADPELEARALGVVAEATGMDGDPAASVETARRATGMWPKDRRDSDFAYTMSQQALANYWLGRYDEAVRLGKESFEYAMEVSSVLATVNGAAHTGMALAGLSRHEEAFEWFEKATLLGKEWEAVPRLTARAVNMWAGSLREIGDFAAARELSLEALHLATAAQFPGAIVSARIDLLATDVLTGEIDRAKEVLPELLDAAEKTKGWHQWLWMGRLADARAEIALAARRPEDAAAAAEESLERASQVGRAKYAGRSRTLLGRALLEMGHPDRAADAFHQASAQAEQLGHAPALWAALEGLAESLEQTGRDGEAEDARRRARKAVEDFAAALAEDRRERFLRSLASSSLARILDG